MLLLGPCGLNTEVSSWVYVCVHACVRVCVCARVCRERWQWSGSLAPCPLVLTPRFVNNGYITAEITYSTHDAHMHHQVLAWPQAPFVLKVYIISTWKTPAGVRFCVILCLLLMAAAPARRK